MRQIFALCRSYSIPIVKNASILLHVHVLENHSNVVKAIQDAARCGHNTHTELRVTCMVTQIVIHIIMHIATHMDNIFV